MQHIGPNICFWLIQDNGQTGYPVSGLAPKPFEFKIENLISGIFLRVNNKFVKNPLFKGFLYLT